MNNFNTIENFIKKVPKTELHLHIEGSLEPELMFKLSKRNKIEIPFKSIEEIKSAYNFSNLELTGDATKNLEGRKFKMKFEGFGNLPKDN